MAELVAGHGFSVRSDGDLLTVAAELGLAVKNQRSVRIGRVAVADR